MLENWQNVYALRDADYMSYSTSQALSRYRHKAVGHEHFGS